MQSIKLDQKGVIQFIIPLILLAGIVVGVYLVQKTQIFKPKAGGGYIDWVNPDGEDPDNCVTTKDGKEVITCPKVKFQILVPKEVTQ